MADRDRIVLVDGYSQIYRSYYAIRGLTNAAGEASNALYGMARFLLNLHDRFGSDYGAVVLDKGRCEHRLALIPEYKGTRPPMPDDLRSQVPAIRSWVEASGWPVFEREGSEADDLIAGVVSAREGHEVAVFSHDKDLAQLVDAGVVLLAPGKKGEVSTLDREGVEQKFGVAPELIVDYLSLLGDSVDNIAGVAGVGSKTAVSLLRQFGGIDQMLLQVDSVERQSVREKLRDAQELLARNRAAIRLRPDLPENWEGIASLRKRKPDWNALLEMARAQGFKSLITALEKHAFEDRAPTLF